MSVVPYDYYPAVLYALEQIGQGASVSSACDAANISVATFDRYTASDPELQDMRADAERRGHDAMVDALLDPAAHKMYGNTNPQMAKIISDNIKWYVSKKDSKRFGDKIEVKHEISLDRAITDAINAARVRALENRSDVVDVDYEVLPPVPVAEDDAALLAELLS